MARAQRDHPRAEASHRTDLSGTFLDAAVAGEDEPTTAGHLRNPHIVFDRGVSDRARWPVALVNHRPEVTRVGDVGT